MFLIQALVDEAEWVKEQQRQRELCAAGDQAR
jgi:hypothetical protein